MATNGMTIDSLNTVSSLTAQDKVPVWDNESSGEPTRKITAQNMANSVKSLASLPNTTEMNTAIAQSTAKYEDVRIGSYQNSTANAWENTGLTITVPTGHMYIGVLQSTWSSGKPIGIGVNQSSSLADGVPYQAHENNGDYVSAFTVALYPGKWYVYTKRASAATSANTYFFIRIDIVTA